VATIHTKQHKRLIGLLIAERKKAGLVQNDLAAKLKRSQTWVARTESGGRRIDVVEFLALTKAIGIDPVKIIKQLRQIEG
jgi:transcriptional regulator with XRE-family HTH domain